ncbi:MAG TPA: hypothetical protein VFY23_10520 [Candidatus Limnocylindrales bacterium]|nr:hypothetical protein [Candidatus Limnocylindrales bacterium]
MPSELFLPAFVILVIALTASVMELRASVRAPVCPRCVHCRHEALARAERERRERKLTMSSLWGMDDADDDEGRRP